MSSISNRFYITALEDGTTLHGSLASDYPLSQAWNKKSQSAIPNWSENDSNPTIHLTLLHGSTQVSPQSWTWYYEGTEISDSDTRFTKSSRTENGITIPTLRINSNLAEDDNVNSDTITLNGTYVVSGGSTIDFSASTYVRITSMSAGSTLGVINFVNGKSEITEEDGIVTMYGKLYNDSGSVIDGFSTKWYINSSTTGIDGTSKTVAVGGAQKTFTNAIQLADDDDVQNVEGYVVDNAVVRCDFYVGTELKASAYASVDDVQDPEYLYVQYNGANGNTASLRKSESANFSFFVGKRDDATPDTDFTIFKVQLLDSNGDPIVTTSGTQLANNIPHSDGDGWRTLSVAGGVASLSVAFATVTDYAKRNLTGIIVAQTAS